MAVTRWTNREANHKAQATNIVPAIINKLMTMGLRNEPTFNELAERLDALLLEGAELLGMTPADLSSSADTTENVDELLRAAFDAFGLDADTCPQKSRTQSECTSR